VTSNLQQCALVILDFLQSKCLFAVERALRLELEMDANCKISDNSSSVERRNLWTSKLENLLDAVIPLPSPISEQQPTGAIRDLTPTTARPAALDQAEENIAAGSCAQIMRNAPSSKQKKRPKLFELKPSLNREDNDAARRRRSRDPMSRVVFHEPPEPPGRQGLVRISLPVLYNPDCNGLEDDAELGLDVGTVLIDRYRIVSHIGKGSFSRVVQAYDLKEKLMVGIKVLRNDKDCFDQGVGEIRLLSLLAQSDTEGSMPLLKMLDFFYYKEHLLIVTELLRDSLYNFYRYLSSADTSDALYSYFSMPTLAKLSYQMLKALQFIHELGICHCDVKPENICMVSASRNKFKLIDFGAATLEYDYRNSYVQSRWYRAPEVMLGLPWDEKVDVWSLGCVLVELVVGRPIFYGPAVEYVLAAQTAVLGDIPDRMMRASSLTRMYYTPDRQLYTVDPQGYPNGVYLIQPMHTSLKELLGSFPHVDNDFIDFVGRLLQFDPARRLSSSEAFDHPWVQAQAEGDQEKNFRMSDLRVSGFRHSELVPSQNASPNGSRDCTPVIPRGPSQVDSLRHSSLSNKDEGSFGAKTGGPGVPEDFRNQLASDRSRSSGTDFRRRLVRILTPGAALRKGSEVEDPQTSPDKGTLPGNAPQRPKKLF